MKVEIIVNPWKIAQSKSKLDSLSQKIQNRQLKLLFNESEGNVPDNMKILASNLLELGDALALLVYKTSKIMEQTSETFEHNLDGSNFIVEK